MPAAVNPIIPVPASVRASAGSLTLAGEVAIAVPAGRPELRAVAELFIRSAQPLTELAFRVTQSESGPIVLKEADGTAAEAYDLIVSANGVEISASHPTGFFYGLQSLAQLLPLHTDAAELPCLHIRDKPRFAWRGVLLDSARHFFSKQEVCTLLDTLARYKLNRLHWHLVDDQGWRIEIRKYPELADRRCYTQDDVREIVAFAAARGITVVPEIEMPGHSAAILKAMPELRCDPAAGSAANVYCAGNDRTFAVIEDILTETFALFPSEFVHIGGDEADKTHWKRCSKCRTRMRREGLTNVDELQSYFIRRVEAIFGRHGRRLLGWDEIMDGGLAPSAAVMYWRSEEGDAALSGRIRQAAERGHQIVMTPQTCCYLDYHQDANWFNEPSGWIGTVTLRTAYGLEPIPQGLAEEHQANILGAQGNLWCDRNVNFDSAGYQLFPRALALAEVGWSPRSTRDYRSLTERILLHLPRLAALRVNARYPDGIDFRYQDRTLALEPELPGAPVHFTLNGTAPSAADPVYTAPIPLPRPTLVRAAIVRDAGTLGRAKPFMACDLLDSGQLAVAAATDSDPRHPAAAVLDGTNWTFWLTAPARPPFPHEPFPHEIVVDLGGEEEIAGFIYEPRTDGPLDGNILQYELCISDGTHSAVAASGTFSGRREVQRVILDRPARGLVVTLRILDAVGGVTAMSGFKLFRR